MSENHRSADNSARLGATPTPSPAGTEAGDGGRAQWQAAETQHRIRNLLALIRSIVHRTARTSETVEDYVMHLDGRLGAVARGQEMSLRNPSRKGIDLEYLLAEELLAQGGREDRQVTLAGPAIELRNRAAMLLGLVFHELAVNAVKYGALSGLGGHIRVEWQVEAADGEQPGLLQLQWTETVAPGTVTQASRRGFGVELIERMLSYELGAKAALKVQKEGLRCMMTVPLTPEIAPSQAAS